MGFVSCSKYIFSGLNINNKNGRLPSTSSSGSNRSEQQQQADTDLGEEWERHECLHDDVSARRQLPRAHDSDWADCLEHQPGTKERLFEEEMEVTWEKGIVFSEELKAAHAETSTTDDTFCFRVGGNLFTAIMIRQASFYKAKRTLIS